MPKKKTVRITINDGRTVTRHDVPKAAIAKSMRSQIDRQMAALRKPKGKSKKSKTKPGKQK